MATAPSSGDAPVATKPGAPSDADRSGWSPLRFTAFRRWWLANLTSNIGSWMLGALDLAGLVTPAVLLTLLCGVGVGQGLTGPIAQTLQPELVPPSERPQAIALGSVNQNLTRAIGPAIGGLLLAATSAALVFFVNAASFLAVIVVVATVAVPARVLTLPREHVREATRAGARFVRNAPVLIAIMIRAAAFGFFASGVWALLPLVARHTLGLGSGGYGLLLGAVGIGALLGATFHPRSAGRSRQAR